MWHRTIFLLLFHRRLITTHHKCDEVLIHRKCSHDSWFDVKKQRRKFCMSFWSGRLNWFAKLDFCIEYNKLGCEFYSYQQYLIWFLFTKWKMVWVCLRRFDLIWSDLPKHLIDFLCYPIQNCFINDASLWILYQNFWLNMHLNKSIVMVWWINFMISVYRYTQTTSTTKKSHKKHVYLWFVFVCYTQTMLKKIYLVILSFIFTCRH